MANSHRTQLCNEAGGSAHDFGAWMWASGQSGEAEKKYVDALALWTTLIKQEPDQPLFASGRASTLLNLAVVLEADQPAKAEDSYREAAVSSEKLVQITRV